MSKSNGLYMDELEKEKVRQRHLNGEFDATSEESEAWAESPEGKATFGQLIKRGH